MKIDRLDELLAAAHEAGILPGSATRPESDGKPWPLVLMIGLGAWLSAIPLMAFIAFALGRTVLTGVAAYVIGALLVVAAVYNFRRATTSVFAEQLGLPVLLAGGGLLSLGLSQDASPATVLMILAAVSVMVAALVPPAWLRALLGALACGFVTLSFTIRSYNEHDLLWIAAHATLVVWLAANMLCHSRLNGRAPAALAMTVESAGAGWLLMTLVSLAAWSGTPFMLGAAFGFSTGHTPPMEPLRYLEPGHLVSAATAACGAAWLAKGWPAIRAVWALIGAVVLVGLSWLNPTLGATLLALAICMASSRWRLAGAAGIAAAWIIGASYYQLSLPLASKALVMVAAATILGAMAWVVSPKIIKTNSNGPRPKSPSRSGLAAIALSGVAVLLVVNTGIWQKEKLLAQSRVIFVELAPVDPRSIMQGDYMALNFRLPPQTGEHARAPNQKAVAMLDGRGIATMTRLYAGEALAEGEIPIELTHRAGRWTMESDAWHFKEGEAERWSRAKFGEFRIDGTCRAILIGMRGPGLEAL